MPLIQSDYDAVFREKTDLERFIDLYKSFGIECVVNDYKSSKRIYLVNEPKNMISISHKDLVNRMDILYYTVIIFDLQGKFISQIFY